MASEMTQEQIRDELARLMGWTPVYRDTMIEYDPLEAGSTALRTRRVPCGTPRWMPSDSDGTQHDHPIPWTLDGIAVLMPDGYYVHIEHDHKRQNWMAYAVHFCAIVGADPKTNLLPTAPTEIEARALLTIEVLKAKKES